MANETPVTYTGVEKIVDAFKARMGVEKLSHADEASAVFKKVLEGAPDTIEVSQAAIDEAVTHYKGKVSAEGLKDAFNIVINKADTVSQDMKTTFREKTLNTELFKGISEKLTADAASVAGVWAKLNPFGAVEIAGKKVSTLGWADGLGAELKDIKNNKLRIGVRTVGTVGAGAILVSGVKDLVGRTDPANDNQEPERHVVKGLIKSAVGIGAGGLSLFNQTLGKEAKLIAQSV